MIRLRSRPRRKSQAVSILSEQKNDKSRAASFLPVILSISVRTGQLCHVYNSYCSCVLFSLLRIIHLGGLDNFFHRRRGQMFRNHFRRQRTPSLVCSTTMPLAVSSARMESEVAKSRAFRAATIAATF